MKKKNSQYDNQLREKNKELQEKIHRLEQEIIELRKSKQEILKETLLQKEQKEQKKELGKSIDDILLENQKLVKKYKNCVTRDEYNTLQNRYTLLENSYLEETRRLTREKNKIAEKLSRQSDTSEIDEINRLKGIISDQEAQLRKLNEHQHYDYTKDIKLYKQKVEELTDVIDSLSHTAELNSAEAKKYKNSLRESLNLLRAIKDEKSVDESNICALCVKFTSTENKNLDSILENQRKACEACLANYDKQISELKSQIAYSKVTDDNQIAKLKNACDNMTDAQKYIMYKAADIWTKYSNLENVHREDLINCKQNKLGYNNYLVIKGLIDILPSSSLTILSLAIPTNQTYGKQLHRLIDMRLREENETKDLEA